MSARGETLIALKSILPELKNLCLFQDIDSDRLELFCENGEVKFHRHRETVFSYCNRALHFGIVLSGAYKLSRICPGGEDAVMHFALTGDVVAALIMSKKNPVYPVTVTAMGSSRMMIIPQETYLSHWLKSPELMIQVQELLVQRMSRFQQQKVMQRSPLSSRVASLLMQMVDRKDNTHDSVQIPLSLTRKEIADTLGVTVESVIRVMSEWMKQGHIMTSEKYIEIVHPSYLIKQMDSSN